MAYAGVTSEKASMRASLKWMRNATTLQPNITVVVKKNFANLKSSSYVIQSMKSPLGVSKNS